MGKTDPDEWYMSDDETKKNNSSTLRLLLVPLAVISLAFLALMIGTVVMGIALMDANNNYPDAVASPSGSESAFDGSWSWEGQGGPAHWGELDAAYSACSTGIEQSPINIPVTKEGLETPRGSVKLSNYFKPPSGGVALHVTQSHGAPVYSCPGAEDRVAGKCGKLDYKGADYNLLQMHFHSPSENTIDGVHYPLELHMVHCTGDCVLGTDNFAVVGVLFDGTETSPAAMSTIASLFGDIGADGIVASSINTGDLVDGNAGFYNWDGSLTTPPCSEGLQWLLSSQVVGISDKHASAFFDYIGGYPGNSRPVQPLNLRSITPWGGNSEPEFVPVSTIEKVAPAAPADGKVDYSWEGETGPAKWGSLSADWSVCDTGREQSPIDITSVPAMTGYPVTKYATPKATAFAMSQSHNNPVFSCPNGPSAACGTLDFDGANFNYLQTHMHSPSENTIDGVHFPLEMHMVHCSGACALGVDRFAVVGVLFKQGADDLDTAATRAMDTLLEKVAASSGSLSSAVDMGAFLESDSGIYNWDGSLTTPPCTEGLQWLLQSAVVEIRPDQIDKYFAQIGGYPGNSRPTQPLNARAVRVLNKADYSWEGETGPAKWGSLSADWSVCDTGREQSPIDITSVPAMTGYPVTKYATPKATAFAMSQSHNNPVFSCPNGPSAACGTLDFDGANFNYLQTHMHSPSENTIDGVHFPLEMHMVHCSGACALGVDRFAVVGVLFKQGADDLDTAATRAMDTLLEKVAASSGSLSSAVDMGAFLESDSGIYNWDGSLTTPPCTEGLQWLLQSAVVEIRPDQIDKYFAQIGGYPGNSRPTQPLNARAVRVLNKADYSWEGETGPAKWGSLSADWSVCDTGREQSPIDITSVPAMTGYPVTKYATPKATAFAMSQSHNNPVFSCPNGPSAACGTLDFDGANFNYLQTHMHSPSENTIDGVHFPLEMHMVHCSGACELGVDRFAVVGVLFKQGADDLDTAATRAMDTLLEKVAASSGSLSSAVDMGAFLESDSGIYNWDGSLTTPPCTEGLQWLLQSAVVEIRPDQIDKYFAQIGGYPGNSRPTQPLNARAVRVLNKADYSWEGETGPAKWGSLSADWSVCDTGREQSPINVASSMSGLNGQRLTSFASPSATAFAMSQSHSNPVFSCPNGPSAACGTLDFDGANFNYLQTHMHSPSENTVNGVHFPLEMHMVHCSGACELGVDRFAVVGVLFDVGADDLNTAATRAMDALLEKVAASSGSLSSAVDMGAFLDDNAGFWNWDGSLTTPPCTEGLQWLLQTKIVTLRPDQVETYQAQIGGYPGNSRPVQPLNDRVIRPF